MKKRAKLRDKMGLDELVHGKTELLELSPDKRVKREREAQRRMSEERARRESRRIKKMDEAEDLEERGAIVHPLRDSG